jgi:predicted dehydrogenase
MEDNDMSSAVRIAVVGLGGWGKHVVRSFAKCHDGELTHLCDASVKTLAQQAPLFPRAIPTTDWRSILANPTIDAVAVVTPAPLHYEMVREALFADKHVYVEKPMTLSVRDAEELVEIAAARRRTLMVGHLLEYHPAVEVMKQSIDKGDFGQILYMTSHRLNLGVVRSNENAFWSLAPHDISIILYLFGQEPEHVSVTGQCYLQPGIEDVVFATLHFAEGRQAQIHVSWLDPQKQRRMVVVGSQQMMVFDDMQPQNKLQIVNTQIDRQPQENGGCAITLRRGEVLVPNLPDVEPLRVEAQHFIDSIRTGRAPRSDGHDGLRVVKVLEQVDEQLRTRRPVFAVPNMSRRSA